MEVVREIRKGVGPSAVTVGKFDGVHRGHQALLRATREAAAARGVRAGVVTFDRHPMEILRPEAAPTCLTPLDEKLRLLGEAGMDFCILLRLEDGVLSWPSERFAEDVLRDTAGALHVIAGPDFQYGKGRAGTMETLRAEGARLGFTVETMPPIVVAGERVSSYAIRKALTEGDMPRTEAMLGRPYSVVGEVVMGRQLGRTLGYPTANLAFSDRVALPANGIYAVAAEWDGRVHPSVASLGVRPTIEAGPAPVWLEVFVLDWNGDLYGKTLRVTFIERLRDEVRFDSLDALRAQIGRDVEAARAVHAAASNARTGRRKALRPVR